MPGDWLRRYLLLTNEHTALKLPSHSTGTEAVIDFGNYRLQKFTHNKQTRPLRYEPLTTISNNYIEYYIRLLHSLDEQSNAIKELTQMDTGWEKYIDKLDREITEIKQNTLASENRIAQIIESSEQHNRDMWNNTLAELRDRDNQRHKENITMTYKIDKIDNTVKWGLGLLAAVLIGGITILVSILK